MGVWLPKVPIRSQLSGLAPERGDAAIGALESGAADLAPNGREPVLTEYLSFAEVFNNDGPFQVTVATGAYKALGRTWAQVILVNKGNPLAHLTMKQLDGIFGA